MVTRLAREEFGELLGRLKERSGVSYQALAMKVHLSKSAVHRYCAGTSLPSDFGTVERIARVFGADRTELDRLYSLWTAAASADAPVVAAPAHPPTLGTFAAVASLPLPAPHPAAPKRTWGWLAAGLVLAVAIAGTLAATRRSDRPPAPGPSAGTQWIAGPGWIRPAEPVAHTLFGVTVNTATGELPTFDVGALRLWDSGTQWSRLEPKRDTYDWRTLDAHIDAAQRAGKPVLYTLGGTPGWAAPNGPRAPYPEDTRSAPPDRPADWDNFLRALVGRYHGKIESYELWVLATDSRFWSGSVPALVDMVRRASAILRAGDPAATLACPGMGSLWTSTGQDILRRFAALGGYNYCDVASVKLYQNSAADPPETMLELTATIDRIFHEAGLQPRIWSTGTTYDIALQRPLDAETARAYAVRFFLVGLYARSTNLERMYFYNWGGTKVPIVLQPAGGSPTPAAIAVAQLERWLAGASITSCGHGPQSGLPANVWRCDFTRTEHGRTHPVTIMWTQAGTAAITLNSDVRDVDSLDGSDTAVVGGTPFALTDDPVLLDRA